jgi:hypothetical protein
MRATVVASILAVALALGCGADERALSQEQAKELLENRNWMDSWPTSENDRLFVYRFTPDMGGGVYQDRTLFAGRFELFTYKLGDDVVAINWPDRGVVEKVGYTITPVDGPKPFDLRLDLRGTGLGPKTFYGIRAETGGTLEGRAAKVVRLLNR